MRKERDYRYYEDLFFQEVRDLEDQQSQSSEKWVWLEFTAKALRSPTACVVENACGYYLNEKGVVGAYLTIRDASRYYMISISDTTQTPDRSLIANALESRTAKISKSGYYQNGCGTLGYWATVQSGDHWYMVSVPDLLQSYT
ncbi:MAG: hypothetical protein ACLPND_19015 [Candidatus Korobacteraceae bacterium]